MHLGMAIADFFDDQGYTELAEELRQCTAKRGDYCEAVRELVAARLSGAELEGKFWEAAQSKDHGVRLAVAAYDFTPPEVLQFLRRDPQAQVARAARGVRLHHGERLQT